MNLKNAKEDSAKADMIKKLVLATNNKNKVIEIKSLLSGKDITVVEVDKDFDPEETGTNFEENAYIKAYEAAKLMNLPALADDSGLEVDALGGKPGIYSSRYAENDSKRIERVLTELKNVPKEERTARFICSVALVAPDGTTLKNCIGKCEGYIIEECKGNNGFGYDPVFFIPELNKTMAELSLDEKNTVSHRSKALNCMIKWLQ